LEYNESMNEHNKTGDHLVVELERLRKKTQALKTVGKRKAREKALHEMRENL